MQLGTAARTVLGFVALLVALAVCLFGAAGTLAFWQAWLYLRGYTDYHVHVQYGLVPGPW